MNLASINNDLERGAGPRRFSYTELALITNDFSQDRKFGQGGFGSVYRGYLADSDLTVDVKIISKGSRQGKKEYGNRVAALGCARSCRFR
ncbi:Protein kinase-like domain superfamily [Sesbania bispinosa]|nr:Protein kinase-like domain superfamily [Sesbania bispinosa]